MFLLRYVSCLMGDDVRTAKMNVWHGPKLPFSIRSLEQTLRYLRRPFPVVRLTHDIGETGRPEPFELLPARFNPKRYLSKKNVFVLRNPRDVLVSYYFQKVEREPFLGGKRVAPTDLEEFIHDPCFGIRKIVAFYNCWAPVLKQYDSNFLIVRYEELLQETEINFAKIVSFLAGSVSEDCLVDAIRFSSFEECKARETERMRKSGLDVETNRNALKFRAGKADGYKGTLSEEQTKYVDDYIHQNLDSFYDYYIFSGGAR